MNDNIEAAWHEMIEGRDDEIKRLQAIVDSDRELVAQWMIGVSLATGHGDTIEDLLAEARPQVTGLQSRVRQTEMFMHIFSPAIGLAKIYPEGAQEYLSAASDEYESWQYLDNPRLVEIMPYLKESHDRHMERTAK